MRSPDALERLHGATLALATSLLLSAATVTIAQEGTGRNLDQADAESRLSEVLEEIGRLQARLEASRSEHRKEQERLKELDLRIQQANRDLRSLHNEQAAHQRNLNALETRRTDFLAQLESRMDKLAEQLRWSYRSHRQSRIRLVLNQDDPALLGRMLAYYGYYARAQAGKVSSLREALTTLEAMQQSIDRELSRISQLTAEQRAVLDRLAFQRQQRQALLTQLTTQIGSEASRLEELERDRRDLEALLERLTNVLADIPPDLVDRAGVEKQKGRLPMPLQGPVKNAYGQSRIGGLRWQGWLIGADAGAEVSAIAYGRVAFADWLRGYGLLIIIDHGQGYMSLYGHNESLLREAGAWVEPGDVISIVGANPGNGQGLYFELRKGGKAIDPATWMAR